MHFIDIANVTLVMSYFSTLCKGRVKVDFSHVSFLSVLNLSAEWCMKLSYSVILTAAITTTNGRSLGLEFGGRGVFFIGFCRFGGVLGFFLVVVVAFLWMVVCYFRKMTYPRFLQDNVKTLGNVCFFKLIGDPLHKTYDRKNSPVAGPKLWLWFYATTVV